MNYLIKYSPISFTALIIMWLVTLSAKILGNDRMTDTAKVVREILQTQGRQRILFLATATFWFILTLWLTAWVL